MSFFALHLHVTPLVSYGHCNVCSSSLCIFKLLLWYLQTFLITCVNFPTIFFINILIHMFLRVLSPYLITYILIQCSKATNQKVSYRVYVRGIHFDSISTIFLLDFHSVELFCLSYFHIRCTIAPSFEWNEI